MYHGFPLVFALSEMLLQEIYIELNGISFLTHDYRQGTRTCHIDFRDWNVAVGHSVHVHQIVRRVDDLHVKRGRRVEVKVLANCHRSCA